MTRACRLVVLLVLMAATSVAGQAAIQPSAGYPAIGEAARITLISAGAGPRRALRYVVPNGTRMTMTMDMTMGMAMTMGGQSMPPVNLPTMRMGADMAVTDVSPAGDMTYVMSFTGMDLLQAASTAASLDAMKADLKSVTARATVTNRGITLNASIDTSRVTNPQFVQMMGSVTNSLTSLSMPLPEEPVGVGARWEVRQASVSGGLTMFQKVECELKALDPRSATLAIKIDQTAPPQPMNNPSLPAGATVMVDSVTGTGTGTMKVALDSLVPTSEADSRTTMVMSVNSGGSPQPISIETTVKLAVAPGN